MNQPDMVPDQQELLPVLRLDSALGLDHGSENVLLRLLKRDVLEPDLHAVEVMRLS
jgi:hypothetical protein